MTKASVTVIPSIWAGTIFADKMDGKIYRAEKCNPRNIRSLGMDGKIWNVPWERSRAATTDEIGQFEVWETKQAALKPYEAPLAATLGTVVEFTDPKPKGKGHPADTTGKFVVIGLKDDGFKIARLGGDGGRYFPKVQGSHLKVADA